MTTTPHDPHQTLPSQPSSDRIDPEVHIAWLGFGLALAITAPDRAVNSGQWDSLERINMASAHLLTEAQVEAAKMLALARVETNDFTLPDGAVPAANPTI